ncbi:MAG: phage tail protein [Pseudomonadota bacterium]|nr:phage tail protein [Pseudomonadota bacterium]
MTDRDGVTGGYEGGTVPPRRVLGWTPPPLPGPAPTTPGGSATIASGAGLRTAALVTPAHRIPILFGRCRITPDIVRAEIANSRADFLCVISEGPIDAVEDWLTDTASTFDTLTVTLGTMTTPVATLHGTIGLAAAYILGKAGRPYQPRCIARGRKPYDPRLGAWGAGVYPASAYCAYSTNPALAMADLKTFPQYGSGWPAVAPTLVDWTSVTNAANWCDALVSGVKRYEINLYLQAGETASAWEETIGLHAGLRWREEGGLWRLDYSAPVVAVAAAITDDHVIEGTSPSFSYGGGAGLADRPNRFRAEWTDAASGWGIRTVEIKHPEIDAGAAIRDGAVYKLHGFQNEAQALRALWRIACDIWSETEFEAELKADRIDLTEGTRVPVTLSSLGLSAVDFLVTRVDYEQDRVQITARRYDTTTWTAPGSTGGALTDPGFFDVPGDLTSVARVALETSVSATIPTSKTTLTYLGFSWQLPTFAWPKDILIRVWPAGATPTWDTAGYTEFAVQPQGDSRYAVDPTWKASLTPYVRDTTVQTFDNLGQETATASSGPGYYAILRLRSLVGLLSAGVAISEAAHSTSGSTPSTVIPALMDPGFVPTDGQIAVWDDVAGRVTFPAALAMVAPGASATIGGRMLIGVTVTLTADLAAAATTIYVNRNTLANGDRIMLEAAPGGVAQTEFMAVTSAASGTGPYSYTVTRNLDASGANDWKKGDAIFNTGTTGAGFIDIYSLRGLKAATEVGPTIVGNLRNSATWNDWSPRWAIGNLNGLYGYAADTYGAAFGVPAGPWLKIDATNGIRIGHNATTKIQLDGSGNATFSGAITAASGSIGGWTIGALVLSGGGISLTSDNGFGLAKITVGAGNYGNADTGFYADGDGRFSLKDKLVWDMTNLTVKAVNVTINADGVSIPAFLDTATCYGFRNGTTFIGGLWSPGTGTIQVGLAPTTGPRLGFDSSGVGTADFWSCITRNLNGFTTQTAVPSGAEINATSGLAVNGTKVVGARGAAVADATDAASAITQLNALLARLRTHGLIAT